MMIGQLIRFVKHFSEADYRGLSGRAAAHVLRRTGCSVGIVVGINKGEEYLDNYLDCIFQDGEVSYAYPEEVETIGEQNVCGD